jgi:hypothetical protein
MTAPLPAPDDAAYAIHAEIRDKQQFELRFNYPIGGGEGAQAFAIDAYLFIPKNIGLSRQNYTRDAFYADVIALLRLDAAPLPLAQLADRTCAASPLCTLHRLLGEFNTSPRPPDSRVLSAQVKLYAYLFTAALRRDLSRLSKSVRSKGDHAEDGRRTMQDIRGALLAYRSLRGAMWPYERLCDESMPEAMRAADEYMSVFLDERLALFARGIEKTSHGEPRWLAFGTRRFDLPTKRRITDANTVISAFEPTERRPSISVIAALSSRRPSSRRCISIRAR